MNWISKLATPNGVYLVNNIGTSHCKLHHQITLMKLFTKPPNTQSWVLFKLLLKSFTTNSTRILVLAKVLGDWTSNHNKCGRWNTYTENNSIFKYLYNPLEDIKKRRICKIVYGELEHQYEATNNINYRKMTPIKIRTFCKWRKKEGNALLLKKVDA